MSLKAMNLEDEDFKDSYEHSCMHTKVRLGSAQDLQMALLIFLLRSISPTPAVNNSELS